MSPLIVNNWMVHNGLKLNQDKSELLLFTSRFRPDPVLKSLTVVGEEIKPTPSARNLGTVFDTHVTLSKHLNTLCKVSNFHLRNICKIRKYLSEETTETLVHAFASSRLDNCNSLPYGLPDYQIHKLQLIQNAAARIVTFTKKSEHITPVLQRLHWLPVHFRIIYKATLYVYHTDGHSKAASAAGVKCVKAKKLLDSPNMINAIHCGGSSVKVPVVVRNAVLASFDSSPVSPNAAIPLLRDAMGSSEQLGHSRCVTVSRGFGRIHGLCYQNVSALERYQASYQSVATQTQPASCFSLDSSNQICERKDDSKSALQKRENVGVAQTRSPISTVTVRVEKQSCTTPGVNTTEIKLLESDDIRSQAFSTTRFDRGLVCVRYVHELQTAIAHEGLWIECKCTGSQGGQYNVSALIDEQGIREAKCTCQDQPASSLGRCKHAIGMLLKFQENQEQLKHGTTELEKLKLMNSVGSNPVSQNVPSLQTNNQSKAGARDDIDESRSLPKWMAGTSRNASLGEERKRKEITNSIFGKKRMKKQKKIEKTVYCMTEEELLETAKMILQQKTCLSIESSSRTAEDEEKKAESSNGMAVNINTKSSLQSQSYTVQKSYQKEKREKETSSTEDTSKPLIANTFTNSPERQVLVPETVSLVPETLEMTGPSLRSDHSAHEFEVESSYGKLTGNVSDNEQKLRMKFGKSILDDLI